MSEDTSQFKWLVIQQMCPFTSALRACCAGPGPAQQRGVQRHGEQRGEMGATSCEGPHAQLLQNYSSQQIKYEPVQTPHCQASFLCGSPSQTGIALMGGEGRS